MVKCKVSIIMGGQVTFRWCSLNCSVFWFAGLMNPKPTGQMRSSCKCRIVHLQLMWNGINHSRTGPCSLWDRAHVSLPVQPLRLSVARLVRLTLWWCLFSCKCKTFNDYTVVSTAICDVCRSLFFFCLVSLWFLAVLFLSSAFPQSLALLICFDFTVGVLGFYCTY